MRSVGRRATTAALLAAVLTPSDASGVKVAVRGSGALEVRAMSDGDAVVIRGTLKDDVGAPVAAAPVGMTLWSEGEQLELPVPKPCGGRAVSPRLLVGGYVLETDVLGAFCVRAPQLPLKGVVRVRFAGMGAIAATSQDAPLEASRATTSLAWDPQPQLIDLDAPKAHFTVQMSSKTGGRGVEGTALVLRDERGVLARSRTDERSRATFEVQTSALDGPGSGTLEVRAEGAGTSVIARVVRTARVSLLAAVPGSPIVPHDGYAFELAAETSRGPAGTGTIEARVGDETVGAATVRSGRARLTARFDVPVAGDLEISFRFLPTGPDLRPGEPLLLRVPVRPPSPWRRAPLLVVVVALVAWLARGWRRPPRAEIATTRARGGAPPRLPDIVVLEERGARGLRGVVLDAHDRTAIAGAKLSVVARDFEGERTVADVESAPDGSFTLEISGTNGLALIVDAPFHSRLEKDLPKAGRATIALVSRRRTLLEKLLAAARRAGPPWTPTREPTPAALAGVAEAVGREGVATWARAVEGAAYGGPPVDAAREAEVAQHETALPHEPRPRTVRR